jgi:peptidoglycan/LPS O-acetylase OafA/YrhL
MEKVIPGAVTHTRYKQLDSLRGLAALTVFFTHFLGLKAAIPLFYYLKMTPLGFYLMETGLLCSFLY